MELSVVVVNWNTSALTVACLQAVEAELQGFVGECVVIDNGSTPADVAYLIRHVDPGRLVLNPSNIGFSAAVNQGLRRTTGRHVVLINPDVVIEKGCLRHLAAYLDAYPQVGIVGPLVRDPDGRVQGSARAFPNALSAVAGRTSLLTSYLPDNPITRRNLPHLLQIPPEPRQVDWLSGACLMLRRAALEELGTFDERFFMYWEDVDMGWRMRQLGWHVVYDPRVSVVHQAGASSRAAALRCTVQFHRSAYRFHRKHMTRQTLHPMNVVAAAGLTARMLLLLAARSIPYFAGVTHRLPRRLHKRLPGLDRTTSNVPAAPGQP